MKNEAKRRAILDAARTAFQQDGVACTSMDKLAALANVSKRTVYNHFASKEALLLALLTDLWQNASNAQTPLADDSQPLQLQLSTRLLQRLRLVGGSEFIALAKVMFGHFLYQAEALQAHLASYEDQQDVLSEWLGHQLQAGNLIGCEPELALNQLSSLLKGYGFWPQLSGIQPLLNDEQMQIWATNTAALFLSHYQRKVEG